MMSFRYSRGFTSWFLQVDSSELMTHMFSAAAYNLKRAMRLLLCLIRKWLMELLAKVEERIILSKSPVDLPVPAF